MPRGLLFLVLWLPLVTTSHAQSVQLGEGRDQKSLHMTHTDTPPLIDGVLDEATWQSATVIDDFHQIIPVEYAEPSERTEVRLLFDADAIYVGVKLFIDPALISHNILRRNGNIFTGEDYFTVSFDSFNTQRGGYYFGVNANGVRADGIYRNVSQFYGDWDSIYFVRTTIVDDGWIAEYAIPYKSISFDPNIDTWGMNFSRKIQARNEQMVWVSNDRRFDPSSAGLATGLTGLRQGLGLDVVTSGSLIQEKNFLTGASGDTQAPSLDVFYKLTSGLNASMTVNTDFSVTEIDDRQVNLTRFSLFFPEKRDFFLREADIFEFGRLNQNGRPFFSRRIGLGAANEVIDLEIGGKVSGRIGDWELGALSIRQGETPAVNADNLSVIRVKTGVLAESTIGAIFTDGNPTSDRDSTLAGMDFLYRNSHLPGGRIVELSTWLQHTDTEGFTGNDAAVGVSLNMPSQEGLTGRVEFNRFEANFRPALGFANRTGVEQKATELNYTWRPPGRWFQALGFGAAWERFDNLRGWVETEDLTLTALELTTRTGDGVMLSTTKSRDNLLTPFRIFPGTSIRAGDYEYATSTLEFRSAPFRKVVGRLGVTGGEFYAGEQQRVVGNLTWTPTPNIRTNVGFNITRADLPEGEFTSRVLTAGFDYVFSNSLSLVNLVQYDNVSEVAGLNVRLHWIPQEGQALFLVLNHNQIDLLRNDEFQAAGTSVTLKYSYTFRY